jgi:hypothetical protein
MQRPVATELFSTMATTGILRALVVAPDQDTKMSTMDTYRFWEDMASHVPRGAKLAMVVGWQIAGPPFIENVAINRWINIRYFNAYDDAIAWLRGRR